MLTDRSKAKLARILLLPPMTSEVRPYVLTGQAQMVVRAMLATAKDGYQKEVAVEIMEAGIDRAAEYLEYLLTLSESELEQVLADSEKFAD